MPIHFRCPQCQQMLVATDRKAGCEIRCPQCGTPQIVPGGEWLNSAAEPAMAAVQAATATIPPLAEPPSVAGVSPLLTPEPGPLPSSIMESDPVPPELDSLVAGLADLPADPAEPHAAPPVPPLEQAQEPSPGTTPSAETTLATNSSPPRTVSNLVVYPRRAFYIQGLLYLALAVGFFLAGYFIGRGDATAEKRQEQQTAARERLSVQGRVLYRSDAGAAPVGDAGALVLALPADTPPRRPLSTEGLGSEDPPPPESHATLRALVQAGGGYARADASGAFTLTVAKRGSYHLLIVSRHATRAAGNEVAADHRSTLEKYLRSPDKIIGRAQYGWRTEKVDSGLNPIELDFRSAAEP